MRRTLQRAIHELAFDPLIARVAAGLSDSDVGRVAREFVAEDPFGEIPSLRRALEKVVGDNSVDPVDAVGHQIWCACRQALSRTRSLTPLAISVENVEFVAETEGHPTILVAPMTTSLSDAVNAVSQVFPRRPTILYGEEVSVADATVAQCDVSIAGEGLQAVRQIEQTLAAGGVLCTYPDFVYHGHAARAMNLFGVTRPVSSGFLSLALRHEAMLLPMTIVRTKGILCVNVQEATQVLSEPRSPRGAARDVALDAVARTVAELLTASIRRAPEQWLLLATLTFSSPQMAEHPERAVG